MNEWNGWREKDYQSQLYMDTLREREAEGGEGRSRWTMSRKDWQGDQKQRGLDSVRFAGGGGKENVDGQCKGRIGKVTRNREVWTVSDLPGGGSRELDPLASFFDPLL